MKRKLDLCLDCHLGVVLSNVEAGDRIHHHFIAAPLSLLGGSGLWEGLMVEVTNRAQCLQYLPSWGRLIEAGDEGRPDERSLRWFLPSFPSFLPFLSSFISSFLLLLHLALQKRQGSFDKRCRLADHPYIRLCLMRFIR